LFTVGGVTGVTDNFTVASDNNIQW